MQEMFTWRFKNKSKDSNSNRGKYFFRAKNSLAAVTLVIERSGYCIVKVISTGAREAFIDIFDWGASRKYSSDIIEEISKFCNASYEIIVKKKDLTKETSKELHIE